MTIDEIIKMAQEAGMADACWQSEISILLLKRFAALVAEAERRRTWLPADWLEYERGIAAAEREECAKVCDQLAQDDPYDTSSKTAKWLAVAIRARRQQ